MWQDVRILSLPPTEDGDAWLVAGTSASQVESEPNCDRIVGLSAPDSNT